MSTWRAGLAGGVRRGAAVIRCRRALKLAPALTSARGELPATGDLQRDDGGLHFH